jgi:hypothetical protein
MSCLEPKDEVSERNTNDADQDVLEELGAPSCHTHVRGIRDPVRCAAQHPADLPEAPCSTSQRSQGLAPSKMFHSELGISTKGIHLVARVKLALGPQISVEEWLTGSICCRCSSASTMTRSM